MGLSPPLTRRGASPLLLSWLARDKLPIAYVPAYARVRCRNAALCFLGVRLAWINTVLVGHLAERDTEVTYRVRVRPAMVSPALPPSCPAPTSCPGPKSAMRRPPPPAPGGSPGQPPSGVPARRDRDDIFVIPICPAFP